MAKTDLEKLNSELHLKKRINYIRNSSKTQDGELVSYFGCNKDTIFKDFKVIRNKSVYDLNGKKEIVGWSMIQSFAKYDNVTPELAHKIGIEFADKFLNGKHQYIVATHTNSNCLHNHIIFNSTSFIDYYKFHSEKNKGIEYMYEVSDEICKEYELSVIDIDLEKENNKMGHKEYSERVKGSSWKLKLETTIDKNIKRSNTIDEFTDLMKKDKITIDYVNNTYSLDVDNLTRHISGKKLKSNYSLEKIKERIDNKKLKITDYNLLNQSWHDILKYKIDNAISTSSNYNEFLDKMASEYDIKQGKHISFKAKFKNNKDKYQEKFIRSKSLGFSYAEDEIKKRIKFKNQSFDKTKKDTFKEKEVIKNKKKDLKRSLEKFITYNLKKCNSAQDVLYMIEKEYKNSRIIKDKVKGIERYYLVDKSGLKVYLNIPFINERLDLLKSLQTKDIDYLFYKKDVSNDDIIKRIEAKLDTISYVTKNNSNMNKNYDIIAEKIKNNIETIQEKNKIISSLENDFKGFVSYKKAYIDYLDSELDENIYLLNKVKIDKFLELKEKFQEYFNEDELNYVNENNISDFIKDKKYKATIELFDLYNKQKLLNIEKNEYKKIINNIEKIRNYKSRDEYEL